VIFISWAISLLFGPKPEDEDFLGRGFKGKLRILVHSSQHIGRLPLAFVATALCFYSSRRERQERQEFAYGSIAPVSLF
jgi:hypothetical protein